jgi:hypothetical protein
VELCLNHNCIIELEILGRDILQCAMGGTKEELLWFSILKTTQVDYPDALFMSFIIL